MRLTKVGLQLSHNNNCKFSPKMAKRKETPKKIYPKSIVGLECMCRLCGSFEDKKYCKNLFIKRNENLLHIAEIINGGSLAFDTGLPNLLCRPCERRLNNLAKFKKVITETQDSLVRKKRCMDESPSARKSRTKSLREVEPDRIVSRRRSLSFVSTDSPMAMELNPDPAIQVCLILTSKISDY